MYTKSQLEERNRFEMGIITQIFHDLKIEVSTLGSDGDPLKIHAALKDRTNDHFFTKNYDIEDLDRLLRTETTYTSELFRAWANYQTDAYAEMLFRILSRGIERLDPNCFELLQYSNMNILGRVKPYQVQIIELMGKYLNWKWEVEHINKQKTDAKPLTQTTPETLSEAVERAVRPSKWAYYMGIAKAVASRSTCLRRQYGAVIVKNDVIIATGYNGAARGEENCCDVGECWRQRHGIPHGEQYEKCVAVHAEANTIISASRSEMIGGTMYLYGSENGQNCEVAPCLMCDRLLRNSGIQVVFCASVDDLSNPVENPKKKWYC